MAISTNIASFQNQLLGFASKMKLDFGQTVAKFVIDLDKKIVLRTPVDTGWARANWNVSMDAPDYSYHPGERPVGEPIGEAEATQRSLSAAQSLAALIAANPHHIFYISNGIPYIEFLEGGHSGQAPNGMVAVSLAEVEAGLL